MAINYEDLESQFDCACQDVVKELSAQYKSSYQSGGPDKLSAFLELIQRMFDEVEFNFVKKNDLSQDNEALRRIKGIAKLFARRCVEDYGKVI
jgi:hypothetical protein